jgi:hypothetical protein
VLYAAARASVERNQTQVIYPNWKLIFNSFDLWNGFGLWENSLLEKKIEKLGNRKLGVWKTVLDKEIDKRKYQRKECTWITKSYLSKHQKKVTHHQNNHVSITNCPTSLRNGHSTAKGPHYGRLATARGLFVNAGRHHFLNNAWR